MKNRKWFWEFLLSEWGWELYVLRFKDNKRLKDLLSTNNISGKQIRDNLGYFLAYGHPEFGNDTKHTIEVHYGCRFLSDDCNKCKKYETKTNN